MSSSTCSDPLCSTSGRRNFQRLTRLLISGCTQVARKNFDALIPPGKLVSELNDPTNMGKLNKARITPPQRNLLYPPPGTPVDSSKFDITILNLLFRNICGLSPPSTGWSAKPNPSDVSFEADLIRIRFHRNEVYGHVDESMEIDDHKFQALWKDISECLLRMAANVGSTLETEWRKIISDFKMKPLTPEEERCKEELESWRNFDKDVKEELEGLKKEVKGEREEIKCMAQKVDALSVVLSKRREENQQPIINTLSISCCGFTIISLRCGKARPSLDFPEPDTQVITSDIARNELKTGVFREQLEKKIIKVRSEYEGSLIVTVESGSLEILQRFWEEYTSGRLTEMATKYLVTQELLDRFGLLGVRLRTTVDPAEYKRGRRKLIILELGDKVYPDLQCIIGTVERLIDEGDVPAALKLISDKNKEQDFERETNFQLENGLDKNKKSVETVDSSKIICQRTTCDRAEHDLSQINTGERGEDAVNSTNDVSLRYQSKIDVEHINQTQCDLERSDRKTNNVINVIQSINSHPKFRQGSTTPTNLRQKGILDYRKKNNTEKKLEKDNDIDHIIKTYQQIQNVLPGNKVHIFAKGAKDWQRQNKKLKFESEDTNERPDSSTGYHDINHCEHQRPHSETNKKLTKIVMNLYGATSTWEFEQRQMIVIAEREKDEKLQSPREEQETDEMALGQQQDPDNSCDSDTDNC